MSEENSWSRKTVSPSFRQSWNQSRQVMRLPVQLWKYSCAITASIWAKSASVAVSPLASTYLSLKTLRPLFSMAPMLKSDTATIMKISRSYSRPNACSSQRIDALERIHGVAAAVFLAGLDIDAQRDVAPRHGDETVLDVPEIAADQREQIGRLWVRIVPDREMPAAGEIAAVDQVAVRQQHRSFVFVGLDARGVDRHHVGPVGEIGDAAEAFGLALRAVGAARAVKPGELGIGGRIDQRLDFQRERARSAPAGWSGCRASPHSFPAGSAAPSSLSAVSVSPSPSSTSGAAAACRIGLERERGADFGLRRMQRDVERDGLHQPVGRAVILQADGLGGIGAHGSLI